MIQLLSVHYRYRNQPICIDTDNSDSRKKNATTILDQKLYVSHLTFIQLSKQHGHIEFDINDVELILSGK